MSPGALRRASLAVALLAFGCSNADPSSTGAGISFAPGARYVALGGSFAAGTGIPATSGGLCLRSDHSYPNLVAAALALTLDDVTCSGATTANVRDTPQNGAAPQLDAVTADTALISLTVGGNDLGYSTLAGECANPSAAPCARDAAELDAKVERLRADLSALIADVRERAPSAAIVLVTYAKVANPPESAALGLTLADVTCSGATTANVRDTAQNGAAPQLDAVTADTALISLTVGGNDLGYSTLAGECATPSAPPCSLDATALDAKAERLRADLTALIADVRERAPSAVIVLVTYAKVANPPECAALGFDADEAILVESMGEALQSVSLDVAAETGVLLADPYAVSDGHGPCASDGARWIEGLVAKGSVPFHPNALGHEAMAQLVLDALASAPSEGAEP